MSTENNGMFDPPLSDGHVTRLRQNWRVHEDGALAQRLQSQEIQTHLYGNQQRNHQIRQDFPQALKEQTREQSHAQLVEEKRLRQQKEAEARDADMARQMAFELTRKAQEEDQKKYEAARDELFARRLQRLEQQKLAKMSETSTTAEVHRPEPERTPPLPVLNGDVPYAEALYRMQGTGAISKGFNPETYNNSSLRQQETPGLREGTPRRNAPLDDSMYFLQNTGAISKELGPLKSKSNSSSLHHKETSQGKGDNSEEDLSFHDLKGGVKYNDEQYLVKLARPAMVKAEPVYANNKPEHYAVSNVSANADAKAIDLSPELLGAAGLSQRDLVLSKRVEAQLEQEKKDRELARRLQDQLDTTEQVDGQLKAEIEAKDMEMARLLHEKERAKLKRAKERSRLKKELAKLSQEQQQQGPDKSPDSPSSEAPIRDEDDYTLPSRKPYINPNAIEAHISSCSESEPQYENVKRPSSRTHNHKPPPREESILDSSEEKSPIPPYMPMQHSKMTSSLERKLNKKKEGCRQQ